MGQQEKNDAKRKELLVAYHAVFDSKEGQLVLNDLKKFCAIDKICFDPVSDRQTNFLLGARGVGLYILNWLAVDIDKKRQQFAEGENDG